MEEALFELLCVGAFVVFAYLVAARRISYLTYPVLFLGVFLGWITPQIYSLRQTHYALEGGLTTLYVHCAICIAATLAGWEMGGRSWGRSPEARKPPLSAEYRPLLKVTAVLTLFALGLALMVRDQAQQQEGLWTGPITILYFLLNVKVIALVLSLILVLRTRSPYAFALLAVNCAIYFPLMFIAFRRRAMVEFLLCIAAGLWFGKRVVIPRTLIIAGLAGGMLVTFGIGALRAVAKQPDGSFAMPTWESISSIDFMALTPLKSETAAPEVRNALHEIFLSSREGVHTYGGETWNRIVFQYVPGQIVGFETKKALMVGDDKVEKLLAEELGYEISSGSTITGYGESFVEFGYFGAIFFFLTAFVLGRYWRWASSGDIWGQVYYVAALPPALIMQTAYASYFFVAFFIYWLVLAAARMATQRPRRRVHRAHPALTPGARA